MARLPKGVYRRGRSYYVRLQVDGKDIRRSLGTNLQEARRVAAFMRRRLQEEQVVSGSPAPSVTLAAFAQRWLAEYVGQRRNAKGHSLCAQRMRDHVLPVLGSRLLRELSLSDLRQLRNGVEQTTRRHGRGQRPGSAAHRAASDERGRLSSTSVRHVLADLRCCLRYAVEVGELQESPWRSSLLPRMVEEAPKRIADEAMEQILEHATGGYALAIRLALLTGLRWGELHRLQWRHVVWVPAPHLVVEKTKSGKVRRVPLVPEAAALLREERARTTSVFVLPMRCKNPCSFVDRIEKAAGVTWHFHQLRHTFACRWLEAGGSKEALQRILGHSTIRLTERYGALSDDAVFAEASRLDWIPGTKPAQRPAQAG